MLILTRRLAETLVIGEGITITVMDIKGRRVRLGVTAPRDVAVQREEASHKVRAGLHKPDDRP